MDSRARFGLRRLTPATGRAALLVVIALLTATLLTACELPFGLGASEPPPVPSDVSPGDATKIVNEFWTQRESALVHLDGNLVDQVEGDDLQAIDRAVLDLRKKFKQPGEPAPRQLADIKVYAPHQTTYPGQFLATGTAPELDIDFKPEPKQLTHVMLFTRKEPSAGYRALLVTAQDPNQPIPELAVDKDGFAQLVPSVGQAADYKVSSDQLGHKYTDTLQAMLRGEKLTDNPFAAGAFTSEEGAREKDIIAQEAQHGVQLKIEWSSLTTSTNFAYQTKDGSAFALFQVRAGVLVVNTQGNGGGFCVIYLPTKAEVARGIHPGLFRALSYTAVVMGSAVVPRTSEKDKLVSIPAVSSGPRDLNAAPCS